MMCGRQHIYSSYNEYWILELATFYNITRLLVGQNSPPSVCQNRKKVEPQERPVEWFRISNNLMEDERKPAYLLARMSFSSVALVW